jgi:hypothetical protein
MFFSKDGGLSRSGDLNGNTQFLLQGGNINSVSSRKKVSVGLIGAAHVAS